MGAAELLERDLSSPAFRRGVDQRFWELVDQERLTVYVRLYARDGRDYLLRLECTDYGTEPIEGLFVDNATRACVASAWPQGDGRFTQWVKFTGSDLFICWDQDRQGVCRHNEWRPHRKWAQSSNQMVTYLSFISRLLHLPAYGYVRAASQAA